MATIHPIRTSPDIIYKVEKSTSKIAVMASNGKVVMLKKPNFKRGKRNGNNINNINDKF